MAFLGLDVEWWPELIELFAPKQIKGLDPVPREARRASWALSLLLTALVVPRGTAKPPGSTLVFASLSFCWLQR